MTTDIQKLYSLRMSVARIAQALGVETDALPVLDLEGSALVDLTIRGVRWNSLALECISAIEALKEGEPNV